MAMAVVDEVRPNAGAEKERSRRAPGGWPWVLAAAALGFGLAAVFSSWLRLPRTLFLVPYLLGVAAFLEAYRRRARVDVGAALRTRWAAGLAGAGVVGAFLVWSVLRQPASPPPAQVPLQVLWLGAAYGVADGLLLSVLPVAATWRALARPGLAAPRGGRLGAGALALAASLLVTAAYHLGYAEFRGAAIGGPLFGCGVMTLAYLATGNPLSAVLSHVAMHVAAVLHGIDSTIQLPPHG